jgi:hypothetical protein
MEKVHFKSDQSTTRVLDADPLDEGDDGVNCGQFNEPGRPVIPLLGYPVVDASFIESTVCNDSLTDAVLLDDSAKRSDRIWEGEMSWVERTNKTAMGQFSGDIVADVINVVVGGGMVL